MRPPLFPSITAVVSMFAVIVVTAVTTVSTIQLCEADEDKDVYPVVDIERGYLLGGSRNGRWIKPEAAAPLLKGGEKYRVFSFSKYLGTATGTRPKAEGEPCPATTYVTVTGAGIGGKTGVLAVGGRWNALPRSARLASTTQPVYLKIVRDILRRQGIASPKVRIEQIIRVDLDGNGTDEVLISANHFARSHGMQGAVGAEEAMPAGAGAGDYSLLILRKEIGGRVKTVVLDQEYYPKAKSFAAPSKSVVINILDLNGDGVMEIVARSRYYEGDSTTVYRLAGDRVEKALSSGCGA